MTTLNNQPCEACRADAPEVTEQEKESLFPQIPEWIQVEEDGVEKLQRHFSFRNFEQALAFTNQVGQLAEREGHHPAILTEYGKVTVTWWTHKISGLHRNDFICAAKTDALLDQ
ncbi:4a-hydroxytetrahydrobiopterin dehydratase [Alcanivorax sp. S6407]|uniref:4a-hydroxytetrahydrobiopterin dehydratase n=1 Tax=Alcanivorax sp. S6407 TaxID=2926424 RepID=UPI001FF2CF38|nr:4a-hydroxytetrahydrobiopterin dehydratase [Alcanivorax sp. S6407]MCK0153569.1 4a-hydroxytetrahydrobiopterin dehydratase [Alcanivorax sp. S6407]